MCPTNDRNCNIGTFRDEIDWRLTTSPSPSVTCSCGATATVITESDALRARNAFISDGVAAWLDDHAEDPGKNQTQRPWYIIYDTRRQQLMLDWLSPTNHRREHRHFVGSGVRD